MLEESEKEVKPEPKAKPKAKVKKALEEKVVEKKPVTKKESKGNKPGIGNYVYEILSTKKGQEMSNKDIIEKVLDKFPEANTKSHNISWYRNVLKKNK